MLNIEHIEIQPSLSGREQQILELVAIGLSAKEVALEIDIAPRTVERHIENIRLKLRARNRTHMVTCAAMAGMLTAGPAVNAEPTAPGPTVLGPAVLAHAVPAPTVLAHAYAVSDMRQTYMQTGSVNTQRSPSGQIHAVHGSADVSAYTPLRLVG